MTREQSLVGMDLDMDQIGFEHQFAPGFFDGDRVAIGFIGDLTVAIEMHQPDHATVKRSLGQRAQIGLLAPKCFSNAHRLSINHAHIVAQTLLHELLIELLKGSHTWYGQKTSFYD